MRGCLDNKKKVDPQKRNIEYNSIYEKYLNPQSECYIKLPHYCRLFIKENLNSEKISTRKKRKSFILFKIF